MRSPELHLLFVFELQLAKLAIGATILKIDVGNTGDDVEVLGIGQVGAKGQDQHVVDPPGNVLQSGERLLRYVVHQRRDDTGYRKGPGEILGAGAVELLDLGRSVE